MKKVILFTLIALLSLTFTAQAAPTNISAKTETSLVTKPKPGKKGYNKKSRAKQVRKMNKKASQSHKRSGGDLTKFNCGR